MKWGETSSEVTCKLAPENDVGWQTDLKLAFSSQGEQGKIDKLAFINGKPYKSSTSYLTQRFGSFELGFHAVVFNPSDHDLVRSDPATRRTYLDRVIAAENGQYLKLTSKYQRVVSQRNAILKAQEKPAREILSGFTEQMGILAAQITYKRLEWLLKLADRLNETVHHIAPHQPALRLVYLSSWAPKTDDLVFNNDNLSGVHFTGHGSLPSLELLEQFFWNKLSLLEAAEWRSGHSLVGPHRDDWAFYLGNQALRGHGSQGEVRSALLALKLCEIDLFRIETGHRPLFLLDDFSSELDRERRTFLLKYLADSDLQTFVTTTEDSSLYGKKFKVSQGSLIHVGPESAERKY
jgi:DNA replication and repair protein RecF